MTVSNKPTLSNEQKVYLLTEIQSKIKEIIGKKAKKNLYPDKILKESDFY